MTIQSVDPAQNKVTLKSNLVYNHYGAEDTYTLYKGTTQNVKSTRSVNLVAEVGLLTRNVKFQGHDAEASQYGAHIMLSSPGDDSSIGRIEFVEFKHVG